MWLSLALSVFASTVFLPVLLLVQCLVFCIGSTQDVDSSTLVHLVLGAIPVTGIACTAFFCRTTPTPSRLHA